VILDETNLKLLPFTYEVLHTSDSTPAAAPHNGVKVHETNAL